MDGQTTLPLPREVKNFVLIGEAGSGKTEVGLNLALLLAKQAGREVHYFDMDQTKPLFRARDVEEHMARGGVTLHYQEQILDAPVVVAGVNECLDDPRRCALLDVGGGHQGAHMIGQYHERLNRDDTAVLYIVNPYRVWSKDPGDFRETQARVLRHARLDKIHYVGNPNLGPETTAQAVTEGAAMLRRLLGGAPVEFLCVLEPLADQVKEQITEPIIPIRLLTLPEWM